MIHRLVFLFPFPFPLLLFFFFFFFFLFFYPSSLQMIPRPSYKFSLALSFLAALIVANVSGPQYIYPTFGTSLNERFNWSAVQNSFVSTACFIGVSFSGPLCAWMIETLKIKRTLQVSALLIFLGPFLVAQTYAGRLPDSFILCAFYLICTGIAGAAAYLCALDSQVCRREVLRGGGGFVLITKLISPSYFIYIYLFIYI